MSRDPAHTDRRLLRACAMWWDFHGVGPRVRELADLLGWPPTRVHLRRHALADLGWLHRDTWRPTDRALVWLEGRMRTVPILSLSAR